MYIAKIFLSYFAKGLVHKRFETTRKKGRKKRRKKGEMEGGRDEGRKERKREEGKENIAPFLQQLEKYGFRHLIISPNFHISVRIKIFTFSWLQSSRSI